ncbi:MAG TPA: FUSC family protein, partial [Steroidobacteraceae bacterium]|nr:FUSC family protein [Steroidobacteraceae bacterium]
SRVALRLHVPDWLPAFVNAGRAFVTIGAVAVFWIVTEWPNGAFAITFAANGTILLAPRADQAYAAAMSLMVATALGTAFAAIIKFAVLPGSETFAAFALAIGLLLVPAGAGSAQPWQTAVFFLMVVNFVPLLAPANQMSYDTVQFYNQASAIVAGTVAAAISFRLLPPLSPAFRTRRLLALALSDLRRVATGPIPRTTEDWEGRMFARLAVLPNLPDTLPGARLVAARLVGTEIIELCRTAPGLGLGADLDTALEALARGDEEATTTRLARLDRLLASHPAGPVALRVRGRVLAISEAITQHASYFLAGVSR